MDRKMVCKEPFSFMKQKDLNPASDQVELAHSRLSQFYQLLIEIDQRNKNSKGNAHEHTRD